MSKLRTTTVEPEGATTNLDLGGSGDSVVFNSDAIKANTFKDAGGNTLWTSDGSGVLSSLNSALAGGGVTLVKTEHVSLGSSVSSVDFDSTTFTTDYDEYWLFGYGIYPATDATHLKFQCGSSYNTQWTANFQNNWHGDGGTPAASAWPAASQWNATSLANISADMASDETTRSTNFILRMCDPTSTTEYKMTYHNGVLTQDGNYGCTQTFVVNQWQTNSALTDWRFKFDGGDIATGTFKVFGLE